MTAVAVAPNLLVQPWISLATLQLWSKRSVQAACVSVMARLLSVDIVCARMQCRGLLLSLFLVSFCSQNHSHGLVWNPKGEDIVVAVENTEAAADP
jgi:hypothetical protein